MDLANAAATCQRVMQIILIDLIPSCCLVYLDDVVVFGSAQAELLDKVKKTFTRYQEAELTLNPKICRLLQGVIDFLGHVISEKGVATDPKKVEAVTEWPTPTTVFQPFFSTITLTNFHPRRPILPFLYPQRCSDPDIAPRVYVSLPIAALVDVSRYPSTTIVP